MTARVKFTGMGGLEEHQYPGLFPAGSPVVVVVLWLLRSTGVGRNL